MTFNRRNLLLSALAWPLLVFVLFYDYFGNNFFCIEEGGCYKIICPKCQISKACPTSEAIELVKLCLV